MRLYQYGRIEADDTAALSELKNMGLVAADFNPEDFSGAIRQIYTSIFPETRVSSGGEAGKVESAGTLRDRWNSIAINETQTLADFIDSTPIAMDPEEFYAVNLQLLGFIIGQDFQPGQARQFMDKTLLPHLDADIIDPTNLVQAFYLMLSTRGLKGLTLVDEVASRGLLTGREAREHLFFNGKSQPVFDTKGIIREVVYVEAPIDTDGDGQRDLLEVAIFRPAETNQGMKVPALFTAEPYFKGIEDESSALHNVNQNIAPKEPNNVTKEDVTYRPRPTQVPPPREVKGEASQGAMWGVDCTDYTLANYFLARGFAQVYAGGPGTKNSEGLRTGAGIEEVTATVAVIEWLNGKARAFTDKTSGIEIKAWWCTGKVAMTDISFMGTLSLAAATTGVEGLETIISESGISSWYDYYRDHGLVLAPQDCQGEDLDVLAQFTFSRIENGADYLRLKDKWLQVRGDIAKGEDRTSGDYNAFWDERNYRKDTDKIKCDVVLVRGLNDWNVKPRNAQKLWEKLRDRTDISTRVFLHQGQHQHMHNWRSIDFLDMMNLWLSHKLLGVQNGADVQLPRVLVQDNVEEMKWGTYPDWAAKDAPKMVFVPGEVQGSLRVDISEGGEASPSPASSSPASPRLTSFVDDGTAQFLAEGITGDQWQDKFLSVENPLGRGQLRLLSDPLDRDLVIDGVIDLSVRVAVDANVGKLSAMIVDYGRCRRLQSTATDLLWLGHLRPLAYDYKWDQLQEFQLEPQPSDFKMITKGHINMANRTNCYQHDPVEPGQFYDITWDLQPTFWRVAKGHQLGLVLYSTDMGMTMRESRVSTYSVDLSALKLVVPTLGAF